MVSTLSLQETQQLFRYTETEKSESEKLIEDCSNQICSFVHESQ